MAVHREIGPGFPEKVYHQAMAIALQAIGLNVDIEVQKDVFFRKEIVGIFRLDIIVNDTIVVELKAVTGVMPPLFQAQTISYLKASGLEVGLLVNFGNNSLEFKRLAHYHNFHQSQSV